MAAIGEPFGHVRQDLCHENPQTGDPSVRWIPHDRTHGTGQEALAGDGQADAALPPRVASRVEYSHHLRRRGRVLRRAKHPNRARYHRHANTHLECKRDYHAGATIGRSVQGRGKRIAGGLLRQWQQQREPDRRRVIRRYQNSMPTHRCHRTGWLPFDHRVEGQPEGQQDRTVRGLSGIATRYRTPPAPPTAAPSSGSARLPGCKEIDGTRRNIGIQVKIRLRHAPASVPWRSAE